MLATGEPCRGKEWRPCAHSQPSAQTVGIAVDMGERRQKNRVTAARSEGPVAAGARAWAVQADGVWADSQPAHNIAMGDTSIHPVVIAVPDEAGRIA